MPQAEVDGPIDESVKELWMELNRGGLTSPSTAAFSLILKCWAVFAAIKRDDTLRARFLSSKNNKLLFLEVLMQSIELDRDLDELLLGCICCTAGHTVTQNLTCRFFNCLAKNLVKSLSFPEKMDDRKKSSKINKLQSRTAKG